MSDHSLLSHKEVVAVLIAGTHTGERHLLFDCDVNNRHPFRLIGGKVESSDVSLRHAAARELNEELGEGTAPGALEISPDPAFTTRIRKISGSSGQLTEYAIHVFTPVMFTGEGFRYSGDCGSRVIWMRYSTVMMLLGRVPDLFFRETISDDLLAFVRHTGTLYQISAPELCFSL
jgi:hypothetical protein